MKQWKLLNQRVNTEILVTSFDYYFIGYITLLVH